MVDYAKIKLKQIKEILKHLPECNLPLGKTFLDWEIEELVFLERVYSLTPNPNELNSLLLKKKMEEHLEIINYFKKTGNYFKVKIK